MSKTDGKPAPDDPAYRQVLRQIEELAASIGLEVRLQAKPEPAVPPAKRPRTSAKSPPAFRMTDRDLAIIRAVNRYRYLRTGQLQRLLFPENRSKQSVQKRLRHLSHPTYNYLGKIRPYVQLGQNETGADTAYFLGPAGVELLQEQGEEVFSYAHGNSGQVKHHFLEHALDLSEFRLKLELALWNHPLVELHRFTADFELKEKVAREERRRAYKLWHELRHPRVNKSFLVYPDALIILRGKDELADQQRLFFLEIDRGTEGLERIRDKVIGYQLFYEQEIYKKYGRFGRFRVLFQTNSARRAANIRTTLANIEGEQLVWVTEESLVSRQSVLSGPIWRDYRDRPRCIVRNEEAGAPE